MDIFTFLHCNFVFFFCFCLLDFFSFFLRWFFDNFGFFIFNLCFNLFLDLDWFYFFLDFFLFFYWCWSLFWFWLCFWSNFGDHFWCGFNFFFNWFLSFFLNNNLFFRNWDSFYFFNLNWPWRLFFNCCLLWFCFLNNRFGSFSSNFFSLLNFFSFNFLFDLCLWRSFVSFGFNYSSFFSFLLNRQYFSNLSSWILLFLLLWILSIRELFFCHFRFLIIFNLWLSFFISLILCLFNLFRGELAQILCLLNLFGSSFFLLNLHGTFWIWLGDGWWWGGYTDYWFDVLFGGNFLCGCWS